MKLIIKPSPKSGERDKTFSTEYGGVKYTVGPKPVRVSQEVGQYLLKSYSAMIEKVDEPVNKR